MTQTDLPDVEHLQDNDTTILLHATVSTQETIGWDNFLRSRLTHAWRLVQPPSKTRITSNKWMSQLTDWIWELFHTSWKTRNTALFGTTKETAQRIHITRLEARTREIYEACFQIPLPQKQHHHFTTLDNLLRSPPTILTLWLTQAEQTLSEHRKAINKGTSQRLITQYFAPQS